MEWSYSKSQGMPVIVAQADFHLAFRSNAMACQHSSLPLAFESRVSFESINRVITHCNLLIAPQMGPPQPHRNHVEQKTLPFKRFCTKHSKAPEESCVLFKVNRSRSTDQHMHASFATLVRIRFLYLPRQVWISFWSLCQSHLKFWKNRMLPIFLYYYHPLKNKTGKTKARGVAGLARSFLIRRDSKVEQSTSMGTLITACTPFMWPLQVIQVDFSTSIF